MHWNPAVGIPLLVVGLIALALIWLFGQPRKPGQGRRQSGAAHGHRREPTLGDAPDDEADADTDPAPRAGDDFPTAEPFQASLLEAGKVPDSSPLPADTASSRATPAPAAEARPQPRRRPPGPSPSKPAVPASSNLGARPEGLAVGRIVAINVVAPADHWFQGADLVVAADKAGLEFGYKGIFHRLLDGKRDQGPLFSVANMLQPGSFDLTQVAELSTTGLSFFMTLPGPAPALDAWDAMLPTAQRIAELLGGEVLDDEHNALGRQRIAHIRDELRAWDRRHQGGEVGFDS